MQAIERGGYTRQDIIDALHGKSHSRNVRFRYELLDAYSRHKADLDSVLEGEVSMSALSTIKRTAKFKIREQMVPEELGRGEAPKFQPYYSQRDQLQAITGATAGSPEWVPAGFRVKDTGAVGALADGVYNFETRLDSGSSQWAKYWKPWQPTRGSWQLSSAIKIGASGLSQGITRNAEINSVGIQTDTKRIGVNPADVWYIDFYFYTVHSGMLNPNYVYLAPRTAQDITDENALGYSDASQHPANPTGATAYLQATTLGVDNLGGNWYRYRGRVDANNTVAGKYGLIIGWSSTTNQSGQSVNVDNVYLSTKPNYYTATWESKPITVPIEGSDPTYLDSSVSVNFATTAREPKATEFTIESAVRKNGGSWSSWTPQVLGDQAQINGLSLGESITSLEVKFRVVISKRDHLDELTFKDLYFEYQYEKRLYLPERTEIDYLSDRIKPFMQVRMPDGGWIEYALGEFLLSTPVRSDDTNGTIIRDVEAYDGLIVLDEDKFIRRWFIDVGEKYTDAVKAILESAGITRYAIEDVPSGQVATLGVAIEFPTGMTKLEAVNELLQAIGYTSLWCDSDGYYVASPYVTPDRRSIDYEYADDEISVLVNGMEEEVDLFSVPNIWIVAQSNAEKDALRTKFTNRTQTSPTSVNRRNRNIVSYEEVSDIASLDHLNTYTRRIASEASQVYGKLKFETALMPFHEYADVLMIRYGSLGLADKFHETAWTMPLKAGAKMKHEARKVVALDWEGGFS
jgi:hypothetical protein